MELTYDILGTLRGSLLIRFLCGSFLLLIVFGVLIPFPPGRTRERARRTLCMTKLAEMARSTMLFQEKHTNHFPQSVRDLTPFLTDPAAYICPSSGNKSGDLADVNSWTDYVYISPPGTNQVLAYCPPGNHKGKGGNIAFADGSVRWYGAEEFTNVLRHGRPKTNSTRSQLGAGLAPQTNIVIDDGVRHITTKIIGVEPDPLDPDGTRVMPDMTLVDDRKKD